MGPNRLRVLAAVAAVVLMAGVGGCAATAEPEPTPTPLFASEEEAFEAAEEVYRAYVEADNAKRAGDKSADPTALLTGLALKNFIETQPERTGATNRVVGPFVVQNFEPIDSNIHSQTSISAEACVDASAVQVRDESGADVTPADAPRTFRQELEFVETENRLMLSSERFSDKPCL